MFCDKLKDYRKQKGVSQEELAEATCVSRHLIAQYEDGSTTPSKENLERFALLFGAKVDDLIDDSERKENAINSNSSASKWNGVCLLITAILSALISIFVFIPVFHGKRYSYPVAVGEVPVLEYYQASVFSGTYYHGNYIGRILFFVSAFVCSLSIVSLLLRKKKYNSILSLVSYLFFLGDLVLLFFSVVVCLSYIS